MNIKNWCKSFLSIYYIMPSLTKAIDKLIYVRSINSSNYGGENNFDTLNQIEKISNLMQKKINLINLKVLTDQTLLSMSNKNKKVLILRYIDSLPCKKVIELLKISKRSYFRLLNNAFKEFESLFYLNLLKNDKAYENIVKDSFFEEIFLRLNNVEQKINQSEINEVKFKESVCNFIINQMQKVY